MTCFAAACQMERELRAPKTAADDNDLIADLIDMGVGVFRRHDVCFVIAGQIGRTAGQGAESRDNRIGVKTAYELGRSLGAEHHGNVLILHDLSGLSFNIQLELGLERNILLDEEHAAEPASLLDNGDLMSAFGSDECRLHAADTAADNNDVSLMYGRRSYLHSSSRPVVGLIAQPY